MWLLTIGLITKYAKNAFQFLSNPRCFFPIICFPGAGGREERKNFPLHAEYSTTQKLSFLREESSLFTSVIVKPV